MSVVNRVWDPTASALVTWRTASPDQGGIFYPGPDAFANTIDYCVSEIREEQTISVPGQHTLSAPIGTVQGLWQLDGDLLDATANGNDFTVSGTERYLVGAAPGTRSLAPIGSDYAITAAGAVNDPIRLTGAMTMEFLTRITSLPPSPSGHIVGFGNTGASTTINFLYLLYLDTSGALGYFSEGAGGAGTGFNTVVYLFPGQWYHIAMTRSSTNTIRIYVNGILVHREVGHPAVTDGSASRLTIGDDLTNARPYSGGVASLRIIDDELRPEHILADASATLPPDLRP